MEEMTNVTINGAEHCLPKRYQRTIEYGKEISEKLVGMWKIEEEFKIELEKRVFSFLFDHSDESYPFLDIDSDHRFEFGKNQLGYQRSYDRIQSFYIPREEFESFIDNGPLGLDHTICYYISRGIVQVNEDYKPIFYFKIQCRDDAQEFYVLNAELIEPVDYYENAYLAN